MFSFTRFQKIVSFILVLVLLAGCAAPAVTTTDTQSQPTEQQEAPVQPDSGAVTPVAVPAPEASNFVIPVTPTPEMRQSMPEVSAVLDTCNGEEVAWGPKHTIKTCGGWGLASEVAVGSTMFVVVASTFAANASTFATVGTTVGTIIEGGAVVAFLVAAAEIAVPVVIVTAIVALPVISMISLANSPDPTADPLLQDWLANRYPSELYQLMAGLAVAAEAELVDVNWADNVFMSTRHPESDRIIRSLITRATAGSLISTNPQGCQNGQLSNGTICLFASLTPPADGSMFEGHVAILLGVSRFVAFFVVSGTVRQTPPLPGESGWERLGQSQYYMDKGSMFWNCAWFLGQKISNGHGIAPEKYWFDAGASWQKWEYVRQRYAMTFPIASISLPYWGGN